MRMYVFTDHTYTSILTYSQYHNNKHTETWNGKTNIHIRKHNIYITMIDKINIGTNNY